jgi:HEAT repeat protein
VIGVIGAPGDIVRLASIAPRRADGQLDDDTRDALRGAFTALLRREPRALRVAEQELHKRDAAIGKELLFALAELKDARASRPCFDVARNDPKLAQQALAIVRQAGGSGEPELDREFATWLATQIDPARPEWTRAVLLAIGAVDEGDCVQALIGLIDDSNLGVRESALSSLRSISGSTLGADRGAWTAWYQREAEWMAIERPEWVEKLKDEAPSKVVDALRAYSDRRLFQSQLALDVLPLLDREEPGLQSLACETLARLGSRVAVGALAAKLTSGDPTVEAAARRSLTTLLGREVPHDFATLQAMIPAN